MEVRLNDQFAADLLKFAELADVWAKRGPARVRTAHRKIGQKLRAEAVKRVPVDEGRLRNQMLDNVYDVGNEIVTEVGTNIKDYPEFLEFGTRRIARGRVLAIGQDPHVTDAQAIKLWPAKNFGSLVDYMAFDGKRKKGLVDEKTGKANQRLVNAIQKRVEAGGAQEQMPWLRPSWMKIREWAIALLTEAMRPPGAGGGNRGVA